MGVPPLVSAMALSFAADMSLQPRAHKGAQHVFDWHSFTKAELDHLFPKLVRDGIVIVDDYFRWTGPRKALDDDVAEHRIPIFWARIDDAAVVGVKP